MALYRSQFSVASQNANVRNNTSVATNVVLRELKVYSPRQGESSNVEAFNRVVPEGFSSVSLGHKIARHAEEESLRLHERAKWTNICLYTLPCTLAYVYSVLAILLLYKSHHAGLLAGDSSHLQSATLVLDNVRANLNLPQLSELSSADQNGLCTSPGSVPIAVAQWSGISRGCLCTDSRQHSFGACLMNFWDCYFLASQPPQTAYVWSDQQRYCAQYPLWWQKSLTCTKENTATTVYKQCFADICVDDATPCADNTLSEPPFTSAASLQAWLDTQSSAAKQNISILRAGDSFYAAQYSQSNSKQKQTPFVQLLVSSGQAPCLNPTFAPQTQSGLHYALERQKATGCDQYGNLGAYSQVLATMRLTDFYAANSNIQKAVSALPIFTQTITYDDTVQLIALRRIYVAPTVQCLGFEGGDLEEFSDLSRLATPLLVFFTWMLLIVALLVFAAGFLYALVASNHRMTGFEWEKQRIRQVYDGLAFLLAGISLFLCICYKHLVTDHLTPVTHRMQYYISHACLADSGIQLAITQLIAQARITSKLFAEPLFFQFLVSIIYTIIWFITSKAFKSFGKKLMQLQALRTN